MEKKLNNSMKKAIHSDEIAKTLYTSMCENGDEKSKLLWEILFNLDVAQVELMHEKIFAFGREIKEKDMFERIIFVRLVQMLDLIDDYTTY